MQGTRRCGRWGRTRLPFLCQRGLFSRGLASHRKASRTRAISGSGGGGAPAPLGGNQSACKGLRQGPSAPVLFSPPCTRLSRSARPRPAPGGLCVTAQTAQCPRLDSLGGPGSLLLAVWTPPTLSRGGRWLKSLWKAGSFPGGNASHVTAWPRQPWAPAEPHRE